MLGKARVRSRHARAGNASLIPAYLTICRRYRATMRLSPNRAVARRARSVQSGLQGGKEMSSYFATTVAAAHGIIRASSM